METSQNESQIRIAYPLEIAKLQRTQKRLRRQLRQQVSGRKVRVAILGGSTTQPIAEFIELFLLHAGLQADIYQSDFNRFYEEAVFDNPTLQAFSPDFIYLHTSSLNICNWPEIADSKNVVQEKVNLEFQRLEEMWTSLQQKYSATIIQNNFELPFSRPMGNLDSTVEQGKTRFVNALNQRLSDYAQKQTNFILHDLNYLSSWFGLQKWYDKNQWYNYKYAMSSDAFPELAHSIASQMLSTLGFSKKVLVCDLDNTLWGGIIGDDGADNIAIGESSAQAQAYTEWQAYLKQLKQKGVLLTVCSKNERAIALKGLEHSESVLDISDFSDFVANWNNKDNNIIESANRLNLGVDSFAFVDDNPAERELVTHGLPSVFVPNLGDDVTQYISILDKSGCFETQTINADDLSRSKMYADNTQRQHAANSYANYDDYLASLQMSAQIGPLDDSNMSRVTQLVNKTNQFNLTTLRLNQDQLQTRTEAGSYLNIVASLNDKFGDNGIVSFVSGKTEGSTLTLDMWLMSCRVFKRTLEFSIFEEVKRQSILAGIKSIVGIYKPTKKNGLVSEFYQQLGFEKITQFEDGETHWRLELSDQKSRFNSPIEICTN